MKTIIVTGSVGTGKTALAKNLTDKLNYEYVDVNKIIRKYKIAEGYDKKRKTKIVGLEKLNKYLIKEINNFKSINKKINKKSPIKNININKNKKINGLIIDSHISHYIPKKYVDLCIVTKCNLKTLEKRLKKRGYGKNKIRENLDAEIFDVCLNEAKEARHNLIIADTTKSIKTALKNIRKNEDKSAG